MAGGAARASAVVEASAQRVFDVLADPGRHAAFDGTGALRRMVRGPDRLFVGARFAMAVHLGVPAVVVGRVVELEEGRRIAWSLVGVATWRYELEPAGPASTRVTHSLQVRAPALAPVLEATGLTRRGERAVARSLALLADVARTSR